MGTEVVAIVAKVQCETASVARELVRFSSRPIDGGVIFLVFFSEAFFGLKRRIELIWHLYKKIGVNERFNRRY